MVCTILETLLGPNLFSQVSIPSSSSSSLSLFFFCFFCFFMNGNDATTWSHSNEEWIEHEFVMSRELGLLIPSPYDTCFCFTFICWMLAPIAPRLEISRDDRVIIHHPVPLKFTNTVNNRIRPLNMKWHCATCFTSSSYFCSSIFFAVWIVTRFRMLYGDSFKLLLGWKLSPVAFYP